MTHTHTRRSHARARMLSSRQTQGSTPTCLSDCCVRARADTEVDRPMMVFPVASAMDRIIITPAGEKPPAIDDPNEYDKTEDLKRLRKSGSAGSDFKVSGWTHTHLLDAHERA